MKVKSIGRNQTEVCTKNCVILISYSTPVACCLFENGIEKWYRTNKFWSVTTSKHINQWLDGIEAEEIDQWRLDHLLD
jgi:hypothetical protein